MTDDELAELREYVAAARDNGDHDPIDTADAGGLLDRLDAAETRMAALQVGLAAVAQAFDGRQCPSGKVRCAAHDCQRRQDDALDAARRLLGEG